MANTPGSPPDGWTLTAGTWNVDAQATTNGNISGASGVGIGGVNLLTSTAKLVSNFISLDTTTNDIEYTATVRFFLASGASVGNVPTAKFVLYQADRATAITTSGFGATISTPTTGYYTAGVINNASALFSGATIAAYGRWEIQSNGPATLVSTAIERTRPFLLLGNASTTAVTASAWTSLNFQSSTALYDANLVPSSSASNIAFRKAGVYLFALNYTFAAASGTLAANTLIQTRIASFNPATSTTNVVVGPFNRYIIGTSETNPTISWTQAINVPTMSGVAGTSAVPYYLVQVFCATSIKAVSGSSSLSVVLLN